jgi:hypothetical protein
MEVHNGHNNTSKKDDVRESYGQGRRAFSAGRTPGESPENRNPAAERFGPDMLSKGCKLAAGEMLCRPVQPGRDSFESSGLRLRGLEPGSEKPAGGVYEHPEKRAELPKLKGIVMEKSSLKAYSIIVRDTRKYTKSKRFTTVALCSEQAIDLTKTKAKSTGLKHVDVDQLTCLGDIDAAPWLVKNESEVEPCQS